MYHYVYQIIAFYDPTNIKHYIGVRSSRKKPEEDNYMGSGRIITKVIKKHGKEKFTKLILGVFQTREEAFNFENASIAKMLIFFGSWTNFHRVSYNLRLNTYNGVDANNGAWSDETKAKVSGENHHAYGKKFNEETRTKMSNAQKGVKKTPEHIEKVRLAILKLETPSGFKARDFKGFSIGIHGETGKVIVFCGARDVEDRGFLNGGISSSISGRVSHHKGFRFHRSKDEQYLKELLMLADFQDEISRNHLIEYLEYIANKAV